MWLTPFGPPRIIETVQEGGLISEKAKNFLSQIGTERKEKGVVSHANMAERQHAILRHAFLKARASSEEE
eukprot:12411881-Prorocentrum_lima.AAC.1